jgi:hypothetical protein
MRRFWATAIVGVTALLAGVSGCGGGGPQEPLSLRQRVLSGGELSGFTPSTPRLLTAEQAAGEAELPGGDQFINDPAAALKRLKLRESGIVGAVGEELKPMAGEGHGASVTVQFGSGEQAQDFLERLFQESFAPCPGKCSVDKEEFRVSGVSDAKGAVLSQTTGPAADRFRGYRVEFADGPFVYGVTATGPLGAVSEDQVVAAAKALYKRVKNRPPPSA